MTWKNRPFIATNFLVVCILSLQYFAQNMNLTKTEKKKIVYNLTRPHSSSRNALRGRRAAGGWKGKGEEDSRFPPSYRTPRATKEG